MALHVAKASKAYLLCSRLDRACHFLQGAVTLSATERYRKISILIDSWGLNYQVGKCIQDYYAVYFASTQVVAAPPMRARAAAPKKVVANRPFTYRVTAKPQGPDSPGLAFRMHLPANMTLKGFVSHPKLPTAPVVDANGQLTWVTPLRQGKTARLTLKLTAAVCSPFLALQGHFYKANEPMHQGTPVPIKNTCVGVSRLECSWMA